MKTLYIKPEIEIVVMLQNENILSGSGGSGSNDEPVEVFWGMSKKNNFSFNNLDDDSGNSSSPRGSVWED